MYACIQLYIGVYHVNMGGIYVFTAYMAEYNVYKNVHNMHMGILGLSKLFIAV